jgi:hypothetical protein
MIGVELPLDCRRADECSRSRWPPPRPEIMFKRAAGLGSHTPSPRRAAQKAGRDCARPADFLPKMFILWVFLVVVYGLSCIAQLPWIFCALKSKNVSDFGEQTRFLIHFWLRGPAIGKHFKLIEVGVYACPPPNFLDERLESMIVCNQRGSIP